MRGIQMTATGGPEVLEYGELPEPAPAAGAVLVDIHAASVNAADWKMRSGHYPAKVPFPHIPGRDFSGVVAAFGEGAHDFRIGDAVFGVCEVPREGAYAERIAIRQTILAARPGKLSHVQAAADGHQHGLRPRRVREVAHGAQRLLRLHHGLLQGREAALGALQLALHEVQLRHHVVRVGGGLAGHRLTSGRAARRGPGRP